MEYSLTYQDATGKKTEYDDRISFLAFVKHATFAGINRPLFAHLPLGILVFSLSLSLLFSGQAIFGFYQS